MHRRVFVASVLCLAGWACGGSRSTADVGPSGRAVASRGVCVPVDSGYGLGVPVYRECGVDRPARVRGRPPQMDFRPTTASQPCYRAVIEMVVDENGDPMTATARIVRTTNADFGQAAMTSALMMRYHPARKDGVAVRQVVSVDRAALVQVRVVGEMTPPRRPRVNC
jgi:hypothetical protein